MKNKKEIYYLMSFIKDKYGITINQVKKVLEENGIIEILDKKTFPTRYGIESGIVQLTHVEKSSYSDEGFIQIKFQKNAIIEMFDKKADELIPSFSNAVKILQEKAHLILKGSAYYSLVEDYFTKTSLEELILKFQTTRKKISIEDKNKINLCIKAIRKNRRYVGLRDFDLVW